MQRQIAQKIFRDASRAFADGGDACLITTDTVPWLDLGELLPLALASTERTRDLQDALRTMLRSRGRLAMRRWSARSNGPFEPFCAADVPWGQAPDATRLGVYLDAEEFVEGTLNLDGAWLAEPLAAIRGGVAETGVMCALGGSISKDGWSPTALAALQCRDVIIVAHHPPMDQDNSFLIRMGRVEVSADTLASHIFPSTAKDGRQLCLSICDSFRLHAAWSERAAMVSCGTLHQRRILYDEVAEFITARCAAVLLGDPKFSYLKGSMASTTTAFMLMRGVVRTQRNHLRYTEVSDDAP